MPALAFLAVAGAVLVALLFVASATLEPSSPPIVTSDRIGLPEPWHSDDIQSFATTPATAPDTTSQAVQPQSAPDPAKIESRARRGLRRRPRRSLSRSSPTTNRTTSIRITWSTDFLLGDNRTLPLPHLSPSRRPSDAACI